MRIGISFLKNFVVVRGVALATSVVFISGCKAIPQIKELFGGNKNNFQITGITGGTDSKLDAYSSDISNVTVNWSSLSSAASYEVTIKDAANSTVVCATVVTPTSPLNYTFLGGSCTPAITASNTYTANVSAVDSSGKKTDATPFTFLTDNTAPVFSTWSTPTVALTINTSSYNFSWSPATDSGSGLASSNPYYVEIFNAASCGGTVVSSGNSNSTNYNFSGGLTGNVYSAKVTTYDNAGNAVMSCSPGNITVDIAAPSATYGLSTTSPTNNLSTTISGSCNDVGTGITSNGIKICVKSGAVCSYPADYTYTANCSGSAYSYLASGLSQGVYDIEVVAVDNAGNFSAPVGQGGVNYIIDTTNPVNSSWIMPASNIFINTSNYTVLWNASSDSGGSGLAVSNTYRIEIMNAAACGGTVVANTLVSSPTYNATGLVGGTVYSARLTTYDQAGNASATTCSSSFAVDLTPPTGSITINGGAPYTNNSNVTLTLSASDSGGSGLNQMYITNIPGCSSGGSYQAFSATTPWTLSSTNASNTVYIKYSDNAGNESICYSASITHDNTSPTSPNFIDPGPQIFTYLNSYKIYWSSSSDSGSGLTANAYTVTTYTSANCTTGASVQSPQNNNYYILNPSVVHSVQVSAQDNAGNIINSSCSPSINYLPINSNKSLSNGDFHACAITSGTGDLKCWGSNEFGQLGNGNFDESTTTVSLGFINLLGVAAGAHHTCVLLDDGTVKCWGENLYGQLGDGSTIDKYTPQTVPGLNSVIAITSGTNHMCALISNGNIKCWGENTLGQLGDNSNTMKVNPTLIGTISNSVYIAAGYNHTCAIKSDGSTFCWGENHYGQLGNSSTTHSNFPVQANTLGTTAKKLALGLDHTCAITGAIPGQVACFGRNQSYTFGNGSNTDSFIAITNSVSNAVDIAASKYSTCAARFATYSQCWGENINSQLGTGVAIGGVSTSPTNIAGGLSSSTNEISLSNNFGCAKDSANTARCWGTNLFGNLGDGKSSHVTFATNLYTPFSANAVKLATASTHSCGINSSGYLYCWGNSDTGQIGNNTVGSNFFAPQLIDSGITYTAISVGGNFNQGHSCGVTTSGSLKCWGDNTFGQLGDGTTAQHDTPNLVPGFVSGTSNNIAVGAMHTCAIKNTGQLYCWGDNSNGQIGDGTNTTRTSPVNISTNIGSNVLMVSAGENHTCAVNTSNDLYCWGDNTFGQLGDSTNTNRNTPTLISSGYLAVAVGNYHTCGLKSDQTVTCWGDNFYGQLGSGSFGGMQNSPIPVASLASITAIASGLDHTCVKNSAGNIKCWGNNISGQLGNNSTTNSNIPTPATSFGGTALQIAAGGEQVCAITSSNLPYCWGLNDSGQVGNNMPADSNSPSLTITGL